MANAANTTVLDLLKQSGSGFLAEAVSNKVVVAYPSATTETYSFQAGATVLYVLTVTYTDSTKANISSAERTT